MFLPIVILAIENESDREYMASVYEEFNRLIFWQIHEIEPSCHDGEDIVNEVLIKLIDKIDTIKGFERETLINYIITTTRNVMYNYLNEKTRYYRKVYDGDDSSIADDYDLEGEVFDRIDIESLSELWPSVDEPTRDILERKYILEQPDAEIAKTLGIKTTSVRMYLTRARKSAYKQLKSKML